jgi:hypothetical protein
MCPRGHQFTSQRVAEEQALFTLINKIQQDADATEKSLDPIIIEDHKEK